MTALDEHPAVVGSAPPVSRLVRRLGIAALAAFAVFVLLGIRFYVLPGQDDLPRRADVVQVLGGPTPERIATAERLLAEGRVGTILISTPHGFEWLPQCRQAHVICRVPDPSTTQGEARMLAAEARRHGWTSAIVTTQTAHLVRARMIIGRCFTGSLTMRDSGEPPSGGGAWEFAYPTGATLKAWLVTNTC